jgi:hypothetical protein
MINGAAYLGQLYQNISALNVILTPAISMEGLSHKAANDLVLNRF